MPEVSLQDFQIHFINSLASLNFNFLFVKFMAHNSSLLHPFSYVFHFGSFQKIRSRGWNLDVGAEGFWAPFQRYKWSTGIFMPYRRFQCSFPRRRMLTSRTSRGSARNCSAV